MAFGTPEYEQAVDALAAEGRGGIFALDGDVYALVEDVPTILEAP